MQKYLFLHLRWISSQFYDKDVVVWGGEVLSLYPWRTVWRSLDMFVDYTGRGVNLMGNLGGRWQTAFGTKLPTRKTGHVETSDTVENKNNNVYYWPAETKAESAPYLGRTWCITVPPFDIFSLGGGTCPLCPPQDLRHWLLEEAPGRLALRLTVDTTLQ